MIKKMLKNSDKKMKKCKKKIVDEKMLRKKVTILNCFPKNKT